MVVLFLVLENTICRSVICFSPILPYFLMCLVTFLSTVVFSFSLEFCIWEMDELWIETEFL